MIGLAVLFLAATLGAPEFSLKQSTLVVPGRVVAVIPADVGGDGQNEILVFWRQGYPFESVGRLSLYEAKDGVYGPKPKQVLTLPKTTVAFDIGDADGDGRADVLLLHAEGVLVLNGQENGELCEQPKELVRVMTVAAFSHEDHVPPMKMLVPLGKGRVGLLLPTVPIGPLSLYERGADGRYALGQVFKVPTRSRVDTAAEDFRSSRDAGAAFELVYPRLVVVDQNGDGRPDLLFFTQDAVAVFQQRVDGGFPAEPDFWRSFGLLSSEERVKPGIFVRGEAGEVNGDGRADLLFNRTAGGISNMQSEVRLFLAKADGSYPAGSDFARKLKGYGAGAHLCDVDGDGRSDLIVPHVEVGVSELIRVMLVSRMDVSFEVHLSKNGKLSAEPDSVITVPFGINLRSAQEIMGLFPIFGEDFTGDGKPDVVVSVAAGGSGQNPDRLEIRPGLGGAKFGEAVWHTDLSATRHVLPFRLRGGSRPGLIVYFSQVAGREGDVWVFSGQPATDP